MTETDIVCVTFNGDARLTALQILSIDRLLDLKGVGEYLIVLNGEDNDSLERLLREETFGKIAPALRDKISFVRSAELLRGRAGIGRRNQQLLKLMVAERVSAENYLLLDAKNHFIHPARMEDFFDGGLAKTVRSRPSPALYDYAVASLRAFEADVALAERALPTITPYVMKTDEVLSLMRRVEEKFAAELVDCFDSTLRSTTEFFLYFAHLETSGRPVPYAEARPLVTTLFTKWPEDPELVMRLITNAREGSAPLFGLHRLRLPQLTVSQVEAITELWRDELLRPGEDANWFMHSV